MFSSEYMLNATASFGEVIVKPFDSQTSQMELVTWRRSGGKLSMLSFGEGSIWHLNACEHTLT